MRYSDSTKTTLLTYMERKGTVSFVDRIQFRTLDAIASLSFKRTVNHLKNPADASPYIKNFLLISATRISALQYVSNICVCVCVLALPADLNEITTLKERSFSSPKMQPRHNKFTYLQTLTQNNREQNFVCIQEQLACD